MNDRRTVLAVVAFLGIITVIALLGLIYLIDTKAPAEALLPVSSIGSLALGGLTGILASTNSVDLKGLAELNETGS